MMAGEILFVSNNRLSRRRMPSQDRPRRHCKAATPSISSLLMLPASEADAARGLSCFTFELLSRALLSREWRAFHYWRPEHVPRDHKAVPDRQREDGPVPPDDQRDLPQQPELLLVTSTPVEEASRARWRHRPMRGAFGGGGWAVCDE